MAALIDEYKQAIQDVLDGRAKEAPRPSELPWTEDKAATMWAAAAAELIAEENSGGGSSGGVLVVNMSNDGQGTLDKTAAEIFEASKSGTVLIKETHEPTPGLTDWVEAYKTITTAGLDSSGVYSFCWVGDGESSWWSADSGTAYPAFAR